MSDNKIYYYMRLKEDFYETDEMKILQSMDNGYLYSDILMKLYLKSLKNDGRLMFKDTIPYNPKMISTITGHNIDTVKQALNIFKTLNLIEILDNGAIYMLDIQNFIGKTSTESDRKRKYRKRIAEEKDKLLGVGQMSGQCPLEIEIEKEIEKEIETTTIYNTNNIVREENGNSSSGSSGGDLEILKIAEQRNFILSPIQMEQIITDVKQYSFNEVSKALEIADNNGKHTYSYVKGILERRRAGDSNSGEPRKASKWNYTIPKARELTEEEKRRAEEELD